MASPPCLLVISAGFPGRQNGAALAHATALKLYQNMGIPIGYVGLLDFPIEEGVEAEFSNVKFVCAKVRRASTVRRFLLSFTNQWPGCAQQYVDAMGVRKIRRAIYEAIHSLGKPSWVILEHSATAPCLAAAGDLIDGARIGFRSHDVLTNALVKFSEEGPIFKRLAWRFEVSNVRALESYLLKKAHSVWCITNEDLLEYEDLFERRADGILGVHVDMNRFENVSEGCPHSVIHLGGTDARKAHGLRWYIDRVWPIVRNRVPDAQFLLGGIGSEAFSIPTMGVMGFGEVSNEIDFLGRGRIFVNTQLAGSGIKLKSLNAMAARRLLVSTINGVRGVPGKAGVHFFTTDDAVKYADFISDGLLQWSKVEAISSNGKMLIASEFSLETVKKAAQKSLEKFFSD